MEAISPVIDIRDIVDGLNSRIEMLACELLPRGRRDGNDWVDANIARGGLGDSMRVCIRGARKGVFKHFSGNAGGDALELVAYVLFGGDKKKAFSWAKSWLGLDHADPGRLKQSRLKAAATRKKSEEEDARAREGRRKWAHKMWLEALPGKGTPVEVYLNGRGIFFEEKVPGSLRYTPMCKHANKTFYPAMLGAVYNSSGQFIAVHRTYLQERKDGRVTKAAALKDDAKMVLGSYAGGFIPLQRGASGKSLKDAPAGDKVILCEGIEDGLSLGMAMPDYRVLAAVSVNNFAAIILPKQIKDVVIAADNDPLEIDVGGVMKPHPARVAVQRAIDAFIDQGRSVRVTYSPEGKDFNDMLRGCA